MPAMTKRLAIIPAAMDEIRRFICGSPKPCVLFRWNAGSISRSHDACSMRPALNCHAVADRHRSVVVVEEAARLPHHAPQDQRELSDALRQDDRLGLKWREFQGCIGSRDDALPVFLLKILADRENVDIGQDGLADEGIGNAVARGALVLKNVEHVDSVVWQDKPTSLA